MGQLTYYLSNVPNSGVYHDALLTQPWLMSRSSPPLGDQVHRLTASSVSAISGLYSHILFGGTGGASDFAAPVKPEVPPQNLFSGEHFIFSDVPLTGEFDPGTFTFTFPVKGNPAWTSGTTFQLRALLYKFGGARTWTSFQATYVDIGGGVKTSQLMAGDSLPTNPNANGVFVITFTTTTKIRMNNEYLALTVATQSGVTGAPIVVDWISRTATNNSLQTPNFTTTVSDASCVTPAHGRESYTYIAPDGVVYPLDVPQQRIVMSSEGEGVPPINYITQRGPFQDGVTYVDDFLQPRIVQLIIRHQFRSRMQYHSGRQDLVSTLSPRRQTSDTLKNPGVLRKQLLDGSLRDLKALILQGPNFNPRTMQWDELAYQEALRFQAFDPVYFNPVRHSQAFAKQGPNLIGPMTGPIIGNTLDSFIDIDYAGEWRTYPMFTILGPATYVEIQNLTTNEIIRLSYTIGAGRTVTIALEPGNKSVTLDDGTNLFGYLSQDSDLAAFHLTENNNGVNKLHAFGAAVNGSTLVTAYWYDRYMGI